MDTTTQITPLLATKLYIPAPHAAIVSRPHLLARLDEGLRLGRRLTLVAAPAGYGKTTLLSEWANRCAADVTGRRAVAWLTLDEADGDPARFWAYVVAALRTALSLDIPDALPTPQSSQMTALMTALINQIGARPESLLLILDDYHLATAQPIQDALAFLLEHQPPNLHLVIAARADPPLPLARLRARGQLTELRQADLCFTPEEAAAFLNQRMGLALTPSDIAALDARTEGWIAGLHMAALALQGDRAGRDASAFIAAFTGAHRYILDYLLEEVLNREPPAVQTFLLQTAILDRMCAPLCDAVLREGGRGREGERETFSPSPPLPLSPSPTRTDSQATLEYLERANLFIIPLDGRREWYRYHRLFGDLLRQRLRRTAPEQVQPLHRRASAWYAAQGDAPAAIAHALAAEDFARAAELVAQVAEATLLRGEIITLLAWLQPLPDDIVRANPNLCVFHIWALLLSGHSLSLIEARLRDADVYSDLIPGQLAALRAMLAAYQIQFSRATALAQQALEQLPEESVLLRSLASWILSTFAALHGDRAGDQSLDAIAQQGIASGNVLVAMMAMSQLAEFHTRYGRLHQAWDLYQRALRLVVDAQGRRMSIAGALLVGLGDLACEWHDFDAASQYFHEGIALIEQWNEMGALEAYLGLAQLHWFQGDATGAQTAIERARQLAVRFDMTEYDDWVVAMMQARIWIAQGNLDAAQRWAESRNLDAHTGDALLPEKDALPEYRLRKYELAAFARLLIAQGDSAAALTVLASILPVALRQQRPALIIEIHLLEALALDAQGQRDRALVALEQSLALAEPEGYTRAFLSVGTPVVPLLRAMVARGLHPAYATRLLTFLGAATPDAALPASSPSTVSLVDPLSERELEVLRLLVSALSTEEIAQTLYLSVHTVRSHLKNLYSKLNVHSRYEAVARAQDLHLL
ncbi:MAG TPA: LuxR C-terminal-related transcriptional regulator [Anaerolineae bacterium]|nr:LuxR C-terminal-related transcriptional regulator [Anaerolineae bacterium]